MQICDLIERLRELDPSEMWHAEIEVQHTLDGSVIGLGVIHDIHVVTPEDGGQPSVWLITKIQP